MLTLIAMEYKLHVFIDHDPIIASIFLQHVFEDFPESAWRLPLMSGSFSDNEKHRLARLALGRYIFPEVLPSSTTLAEVASRMETEFGIQKNWQSHFEIFQTQTMQPVADPAWQGKPLPWATTLGEALSFDEEYMEENKQQVPPIVHLVLATKSIPIGRTISLDFLMPMIPSPRCDRNMIWDLLDHYHVRCNSDRSSWPKSGDALNTWRHAKYGLAYFSRRYERGSLLSTDFPFPSMDEFDSARVHKQEKADAKAEICALARSWKSLVLDSGLTDDIIDRCLQEDDMEHLMRLIWKRKHEIVNEWKDTERGKAMLKFIKEKTDQAFAGRPTFQQPPPAEVQDPPPIRDTPNPRLNIFSIRTEDGLLSPTHSTFTNKSGIMLWGQLRNIFYGSRTDRLTNDSTTVPAPLPGGTIIQRIRSYRSTCRTGTWKIQRYHSSLAQETGIESEPNNHAGWVFCHESIDAREIIRQVRAITKGEAISNNHSHPDKGVLYIGRYDWAQAWKDPADPDFDEKFLEFAGDVATSRTLVPFDEYDEPEPLGLFTNPHFMAMDASRFDQRILEVHCSKLDIFQNGRTVERVFGESESDRFGGYVQKSDTEYEFGWLVFSGEKVGEPKSDELIGIIYDGSYEVLEGLRHRTEGDDSEA